MIRYLFTLLFVPLTFSFLHAQMWNGRDTLYGNEWINYRQEYYKITVYEDGVYRIPYEVLRASGIPVDEIASGRYRLYHLGQEAPLYAPAAPESPLQSGDYLEFYGEQNRSELDRYLFQAPEEELLNPEYSLFTDTAAYFLTVGEAGANGLRYRELQSDLSNPPKRESYIWYQQKQVYTGALLKRGIRSGGFTIFYSHFDIAEGYGSKGNRQLLSPRVEPQSFKLDAPGMVPGGPDAGLRARFACGAGDHDQEILVNGQPYYRDQFPGFSVRDTTLAVPISALRESVNEVVFRGRRESGDNQSVALLELTYPRTPDLDGQSAFSFQLSGDGSPKYVEFTGYPAEAGEAVLYNPELRLRLRPDREGGTLKVLFPAFSGRQNWRLLGPERDIRRVQVLRSIPFDAYPEEDAEYIIITHASLNREEEGRNPVAEYAAYRASPEGGGYRTAIIDVQQLYDQFAYGVQQHSIALRNFGHFIKKHWTAPRYIFLIGKGMVYSLARLPAAGYRAGNLVPTFGRPGSDNLLFSTNTSSTPVIPVGRIAAASPEAVRVYLEKVKRHESTLAGERTYETQAWRKRVLHLVGGNAREQALFSSYLNGMADVLSSNGFGAEVTTVDKSGSEPGQPSNAETVIRAMNEGVAIKTFLGHGNVTKTDFGFDDPAVFDNHPRYPLIFSLGCLSGNLFAEQYSISEAFVFRERGGAIAYIASSGFGAPPTLSALTGRFYELAGGAMYGRGLGDIVSAVRADFDDNPNFFVKNYVEQMSYHGDPAVPVTGPPGPDYVIDYASARLEPAVINVRDDSMNLQFTIANIGRVDGAMLTYQVELESPAGMITTHLDSVRLNNAFARVQTRLSLPRGSGGLNRLYIRLDPDNVLAEAPAEEAEANNELVSAAGEKGIAFFVIDNEALPADPPEFGITSAVAPTLTAYTTNPFGDAQTYRLELDTTARFTAPLATGQVRADGGLISWQPDIDWTPNRVYYWRIGPLSGGPEDSITVWNSSSFLYSDTLPEGWNQSHHDQFLRNEFSGLRLDQDTRSWHFDDISSTVIGQSNILSLTNDDRSKVLLNNERILNVTANPSVGLVVLDAVSGQLVLDRAFRLNRKDQRKALMDFLQNSIADSQYAVLVFSRMGHQHYHLEEWESDSLEFGYNLYSVLESLGARQIRELKVLGSVPYVFAFQKNVDAIGERIALPGEERELLIFSFSYPDMKGVMQSTLIGPAAAWGKLIRQTGEGASKAARSRVKVLGRSAPGADPVILPLEATEGEVELSSVSARRYPYLQLQLTQEDSLARTPAGLDFWRVLGSETPRIIVDLEAFRRDTLARGEPVRLNYHLHNLAASASGRLLIRYTLTGPQNEQLIRLDTVAGIAALDSLGITLEWATADFRTGPHRLLLEVTAADSMAGIAIYNGIGERPFYIQGDGFNPLLDVTFDGVHIMDGDLVSAEPYIMVALQDENPYLLLRDTALFDLRLTHPSGEVERISLADERVLFKPAAPGDRKNRAVIEFQPVLEQDGIYQLEVAARDVSGNPSGDNNYRISFEVIAQASISRVLPYPNPFSTATRFSYTLTGSEPPAYFQIRIMTTAGRVVREISKEEFGPMRVGTHLSEFVWDGTDEFGDRLANGVYLYQVIVKDEQEQDYERYERSEIDRFFRKGFGKIVILR